MQTAAYITPGSQYEPFHTSMTSKTAAFEKLLKNRATFILDLHVPEGGGAAAGIAFRDRAA